MSSSNLRRLRFMQKSEDKVQQIDERNVETLINDDSMWIKQGFEEIHKFHDEKTSKQSQNLKIRYLSRRSYNGANPAIENYMIKLKHKQSHKS